MPKGNIRFIRIRGRVVPIRSHGEAAWEVGKKGAVLGAKIGAAIGVGTAAARVFTDSGGYLGKFGKFARFGVQGSVLGASGIASGLLNGAILGGLYGAATFKRKSRRG